MNQRKNEKAFTLVELLLVVTIIGILAGAVLVNFRGQTDNARKIRAKSDIERIGSALGMYEIAIGSYPTTDQGLEALTTDPGVQGWGPNPYLEKKSLKDPWLNEYQYRCPPTKGANYDLFSLGKDGSEGTEDDIGNWDEEETK